MDKPIKINFHGIKILNVVFNVNPSYKAEEKSIPINCEIAVKSNHLKPNKLQVFLKVALKQKNSPFTFSIEGMGIFTLDGKPNKKAIEQMANINCPAIVFPFIREAIANLTGRSGFAPLYLPPVNFIEIAKKTQKHQQKKAKGK